MELQKAVYVLLEDLKEGKKGKVEDYEEMSKGDFNEAVYIIKTNRYADGVVAEKAGIGNDIQYAFLENAKINLRGIDYLDTH